MSDLGRTLADQHVMNRNDELADKFFKALDAQEDYDPSEQDDLLQRFLFELTKVTKDGGKKRKAKKKNPWYQDEGHRAAIFSHLYKYEKGELVDADSGAHPLVHLAWRALAIACIETGNVPKD